jgi:CheY-like chemotaxis protein
MHEPYLVSLAGFTQFERDGLAYCFRQTAVRKPTYRLVDGNSKADFVVADGDSHAIVGPLARQGHFHRTVFVGGLAAPDAQSRVPRPIDPLRILLCLDALAARRDLQPEPAAPSLDALDTRDGQRIATRASARAAVRRARQETEPQEAGSTEDSHAVLVLDDRDGDLERLCGLLQVFGFNPCRAPSLDRATQLLQQCSFEAAFVSLALDDDAVGGGAALCRHIKQAAADAAAHTAVVAVSSTKQQADRVRALLAGGDAVLTKPLGRGDVARALETCGVRLPADPRRH